MAGAAALILVLSAAAAQAAPPSALVYAVGSGSSVSQFGADSTGSLSPLTPASVPGIGAATGAAISPGGRDLYVVSQAGNNVSHYTIGDDGTLTQQETVAAGTGPFGIAIAPDGRHAYVANQTAGTITIYDVGADGALTAHSDQVGARPGAIEVAITPNGTSAYVTNFSDATVSQYDVDPSDGNLKPKSTPTVAAGTSPLGIAVSADGTSVYVANRLASGTVHQFSIGPGGALQDKSPAAVPAGARPVGVAAGENGVYVTNYADDTVSQYAVATDGTLTARTPIAAPPSPFGLVLAPNGDHLYVASNGEGTVGQFDVAADGTLSVKDPAAVGGGTPLVALATVRAPDVQPPTVDLRTPAEGAQYTVGERVEADYSCADEGGSGLASCTGDVADGDALDTSATGDHDFTVTARDGAGHETAVTHHYTVTVPPDDQPPAVDLRAPADGAVYDLDADVAADYSCADEGGSGLASCDGDVADGAPIDTSTAGPHTFTVVARDGAGHETTVSHSYTVGDGFAFEGFVGPVHDGSVVHAGSRVLIRFSLGGFHGSDVLAGSPTSARVDCDGPGTPTTGRLARSDDGLQYDAATGSYTFAWQTERSWAWTCRAFILTLRDGSVERLVVSFRSWGWYPHSHLKHGYRRR